MKQRPKGRDNPTDPPFEALAPGTYLRIANDAKLRADNEFNIASRLLFGLTKPLPPYFHDTRTTVRLERCWKRVTDEYLICASFCAFALEGTLNERVKHQCDAEVFNRFEVLSLDKKLQQLSKYLSISESEFNTDDLVENVNMLIDVRNGIAHLKPVRHPIVSYGGWVTSDGGRGNYDAERSLCIRLRTAMAIFLETIEHIRARLAEIPWVLRFVSTNPVEEYPDEGDPAFELSAEDAKSQWERWVSDIEHWESVRHMYDNDENYPEDID